MDLRKVKKGIKIILRTINPARMISLFYINQLNRNEFRNPLFQIFNERPVEYRFVFEQISEIYPKTILDIGPGITALPHLMANCGCKVTAIDNIRDYWAPLQFFNRHFYVINDSIVNPKIKDTFDLITCVSTLEHIENFDKAVSSMFSLLNKNGYLILTFPYTDNKFIENVYTEKGTSVITPAKYKTHSYSRTELNKWIDGKGKIIKQEYWKFFDGNFWTSGNKLELPIKVTQDQTHQISCVLLQKI